MAQADKPRRKFLRQTLGAILLSGSLIVSEFARWIHDDCSDIFYRAKRLLNHLVAPRAGHFEDVTRGTPTPRHFGKFDMVFVDGHVETGTLEEFYQPQYIERNWVGP